MDYQKYRILVDGPGSKELALLTPEQLFIKYGMYFIVTDGWKETNIGLVWIERVNVKVFETKD